MTSRAQLESQFWAITGRELTGAQVDDLVDAAEAYAAERSPRRPQLALEAGGAELYPLISVLAKLMLGDEAGATIHELPRAS